MGYDTPAWYPQGDTVNDIKTRAILHLAWLADAGMIVTPTLDGLLPWSTRQAEIINRQREAFDLLEQLMHGIEQIDTIDPKLHTDMFGGSVPPRAFIEQRWQEDAVELVRSMLNLERTVRDAIIGEL